jgi:hypothetical protein
MYFILAIAVLFVLLCIYFFFSAEKLQRQLIIQRREGESTRKENKTLVDFMALISNQHEEFSKAILQKKMTQAKLNDNEALLQQLELISPLINNYSLIFRECLKEKNGLKAITKKCFDNHSKEAFKQFVALLVTSDKRMKRYWSSNNLKGFMSLVDALLTLDAESSLTEAAAQQKPSTITSENNE